ncbi:hypothetical protein COO91_04746 [Nostoc flagelliforme CCNUN1]|uniref:Lipopolysaccharide assembly protein A domain-containing protein n=1 Tax=Nostoc flagelliforme CCNUN1 TaxID=2038116 RepID=A0A2K8STK7_9NOSO|nr:hypothetical protein [Nostoc flagelliforme]AUB38771.1 hypothetical protein COO91_04746 [Nostoc flagelliforme CCNUN1]
MTLSALQKFLLPPAIASLSVFSLMSFPLATLGDKQIAIKFQEEPIFYGKLRDIAIPYVVFATALSIGSGISALAFCGWRNSSSKSAKIQQELSNLEQHLQQKETLLKEWQVSEPRLQISGLSAFLDDEVPFDQALNSKNSAITASQPIGAQIPTPAHTQPVNTVPKVATQKNTTTTIRDIAATSAFASAQTFLGYAQENPNNIKEITASEVNQIAIMPSEFEELQNQIKEMMLQMQAMQENLQLTSQPTNAEVKSPAKFQIYYNTVL